MLESLLKWKSQFEQTEMKKAFSWGNKSPVPKLTPETGFIYTKSNFYGLKKFF